MKTKKNNTTFFVTDHIVRKYGFEASLIFGHIAWWCCKGKFDSTPQAIATYLRISKTTAKKYRDLFARVGYFNFTDSKYKHQKALKFNFDSTDIDAHKLFETYQTTFGPESGSVSKPDNGIALIEVNLDELPKNMPRHQASFLRGLLIFKGSIRDKLASCCANDYDSVEDDNVDDVKYEAQSYVKIGLQLGLHAKTIAKYIAILVKQGFIQVLRKRKSFNGALIIMTGSKLLKQVINKSKRIIEKIKSDTTKPRDKPRDKSEFIKHFERPPITI